MCANNLQKIIYRGKVSEMIYIIRFYFLNKGPHKTTTFPLLLTKAERHCPPHVALALAPCKTIKRKRTASKFIEIVSPCLLVIHDGHEIGTDNFSGHDVVHVSSRQQPPPSDSNTWEWWEPARSQANQ